MVNLDNFFNDLNQINQTFDGGVPRMLENNMVIGNQEPVVDSGMVFKPTNQEEQYKQSVLEVASGDWSYKACEQTLITDWLNRDEKLHDLLGDISGELITFVRQHAEGDQGAAIRGFEMIIKFITDEIKEDIEREKWERADD